MNTSNFRLTNSTGRNTANNSNVKLFFAKQLDEWTLLKNNTAKLNTVQIKNFEFDGFVIKVQYNPERIISTSAQVDEQTIKNRKCFLCSNNLFPEQKILQYNKSFSILCNPYPIFPEHLTIANTKHINQGIYEFIDELLNIVRDFSPGYSVIYNGPDCGASAPDHMHLQAGTVNFLPVENEYQNVKSKMGSIIFENEKISAYTLERYLRRVIVFESYSKSELITALKRLIKSFKRISPNKKEPSLNLISFYRENKWVVFLFPRSKHRPEQFFYEGSNKLLVSPAAIDLGGILITPREEDFKKINKDVIVDIFRQVSLTTEYFEFLKKKIKDNYLRKIL